MSDGGAAAILDILRVPVAREVLVLLAWYGSLRYALVDGDWTVFLALTLVGVVLGFLAWRRLVGKRSSGAGALLWIVGILCLCAPLLFFWWRRRTATGREDG